MSEYIPTTADVRSNYEEARCSYFGVSGNHFEEEFDRWLAGVKADAWDAGVDVGWDARGVGPDPVNPYRGEQA